MKSNFYETHLAYLLAQIYSTYTAVQAYNLSSK